MHLGNFGTPFHDLHCYGVAVLGAERLLVHKLANVYTVYDNVIHRMQCTYALLIVIARR